MNQPMKKLKEILDKAYNDGVIPKGMTPAMIHQLWIVYWVLYGGGKAEFISEGVRQTLEKCGIRCQPAGIGWVATCS